MKTLLLITALYAATTTYPAYRQVSAWTTAALDEWAAVRVGLTPDQAVAYAQISDAMEGAPATRMVKP